MDALRQSTDLLAKYFDDVDSQMKHVEKCLSMQFEDSYSHRHPSSASSDQYNPMKLLARINTLERELPEMSEQLKTLMDEKSWLPCETVASTATKTSAILRAVSTSKSSCLPSAGVLQSNIERSRSEFEDGVTKYRFARYQLAVRDSHLETQAVRFLDQNVVDNNISSVNVAEELFKNVECTQKPEQNDSKNTSLEQKEPPSNKEEMNSEKPKRRAPTRERKSDIVHVKRSGGSRDNSVETSASSGFEPIKKAAFNRLARNLKLKAGKLANLNELYEKIFNILTEHGSPLSDAELMEATGETGIERFSALRGLSALRLSDGNWALPNPKR